jgi:hypothetical protein
MPPSRVVMPVRADRLRLKSFRECLSDIGDARYPQPMSDSSLTESANAESHNESSPSAQPKALQWITYAALAIAVLAVILAALAYFVPAHNSASATPQQGGDAKANVCAAYAATRKAVVLNTHLQSQNPDSQLAVATNARLALIGGGAYLSQRLAANTAAPADLANAANSLANTIQQLGINYLNQAPADVQDPVRKDLSNELSQLDKLCA